ncbi:MAG: amidohydrolase family protein [Propionibacteriaceae bacterium]|nr:amidohydrolase family protein [Propionibacteriaceae bacterium]
MIDAHTHYVPSAWPDLNDAVCPAPDWPWLKPVSEREAMIMVGSAEFRRIGAQCWAPEVRRADMAASGVTRQVVSPTPVFFEYARSGREAAKVARVFNDIAREMFADAGDEFLTFCQVPLQDTDLACAELERSLANGHVGVEIGNHVGDRDLDDEGVLRFLQHCADLGAPVFVHPWDMPSSPRLARWMGRWLAGMPAETHLSLLSLVLSGAFDRLPSSLRIAFAHGGGSFAFWLGRVENAWHRSPLVSRDCDRPPSSYLGRFYVDSVVFDQRALRLLVDTVGADRVLVGSDYPYPLGETPVGQVLTDADWLDDTTRDLIRSGNAERFLGVG